MNRKLRLLVCSPSDMALNHGVGAVLHHHVSGFLARGHQVAFATSREHAARIAARDYPGLSVRGFDITDRQGPWNRYQGASEEYLEYVSRFDGDVVISHMNGGWTSDLLACAPRKTNARRVTVGHGYHRLPFRPIMAGCTMGLYTWLWRTWRSLTLARTLARFDHLVFLADSPHKNRGFYDLWVARRHSLPYSIIPNGVDPIPPASDIGDALRNLGIGTRPYVLDVSNYVDGKNQEGVLRCFLRAETRHHDLVFIGADATAHKAKLDRLVRAGQHRLGNRRVFVLTEVPRSATVAAFGGACLFLMLSDREAQPMVLLEAMAAGLPFVSYDVGCVRDFAGGIVADNPRQAVHAVNRLLADSACRQKLAADGRQRARERYAWPSIIDAYEQMLYRIAGSPSGVDRPSRLPPPEVDTPRHVPPQSHP